MTAQQTSDARKAKVAPLQGPYRVRQEFVRGRNLPFYIIVGKGLAALRYTSGRRVTFHNEAAASQYAGKLATAGGAQ